ncbi:protein-(glutamine-N5) methyltransferase, release factor-specific [Sulfurihydrogenibium azorense Az-Fu1]|jgi:release factor glutamine methyltransferase|uniref:Release factor glutamine methyltransferase n=1 Tax=Sulfurihydrogenibium azorense (strain DSM 15241 / OCM 825 / Az-Fu1) TaxID=204536 RepID=C1DV74_SULAA|nr:peptide chain release factor N(5)-glutamine methyltransferase [Sulfurihydrogenibium azorense]ACN99316.1 protein-(glutamine-N5) methyltransferase, release factor-specific [Sulfurihydrogenibium azorense Az-Fu1]
MKLKTLFEMVVNILKKADIENPQLEALIILQEILKIPKHKIFTDPDLEIKDYQEAINVALQRSKKVPLGYLIKKKEFFGLEFYIEEGVLIPRPETEVLVEKVLHQLENLKNPLGLEVGVGSGCISVSLLYNKKDLKMYALDISEKALKITKINAEKYDLLDRLTLIKFDVMKDDVKDLNLDRLDFVVSNPPYISEDEYESLPEEVKKEPKEALISGKVGTEFYEKIVEKFKNYLKEYGFFAFEIGINQAEKVKSILERNGFKNIKIYKDLAGIDRVLIASKI